MGKFSNGLLGNLPELVKIESAVRDIGIIIGEHVICIGVPNYPLFSTLFH